MGDGTLSVLVGQESKAIDMPSNVDAVTDLDDFEGEVYCIEEDLRERLEDIELISNVQMISWDRIGEIIKEHDLVTTF